eukprot:s604_g6.t1
MPAAGSRPPPVSAPAEVKAEQVEDADADANKEDQPDFGGEEDALPVEAKQEVQRSIPDYADLIEDEGIVSVVKKVAKKEELEEKGEPRPDAILISGRLGQGMGSRQNVSSISPFAQLKEVIVAEVREEPPGFPSVWKLFNAEFRSSFERRERHIASTKCFNALIMTMVVVNTLLVGIEVDFAIEVIAWDRFGFVFLEGLFCLLFTTELALRIHQQQWAFFQDREFLNLLDYSLVVISWLDVAVSVITYRERVQFASTVRVFRFVRFIRLAEGRFFGLFKTLGIDVIG